MANDHDLDAYRKIPFSVLPKPSVNDKLKEEILGAMELPKLQNGLQDAAMNKEFPAGFTYLAQFIVHDLLVVGKKEIPTLGLEPLYGRGPIENPKYYSRSQSELPDPWSSLLGTEEEVVKQFEDVMMRLKERRRNAYDVPREAENPERYGKASPDMGSAFNDLNFLVLQVHCAFILFHNAVAFWLSQNKKNQKNDDHDLLKKTQETVIRHYQWLIVHQLLPMLTGEEMVSKLLSNKKQFRLFKPNETVHLMPEFSKAAMRFGHSQVREIYVFPFVPSRPDEKPTLFKKNKRVRLFIDPNLNTTYGNEYKSFNKKNGEFAKQNWAERNLNLILSPVEKPKKPQDLGDLRGGINRDNLEMDWSFFFDYGAYSDNGPQPSLAIDHKIVEPLFKLFFFVEKGKEPSLPKRDMAQNLEDLPTGHALYLAYLAKYPDSPKALTSEEVSKAMGIEGLRVEDLPLWLYILLEAELRCEGKHLGELGGRIVAEQIIWLLLKDEFSFLNQKNEDGSGPWQPETAFLKWRDGKPFYAKGMTDAAQKFCVIDLIEFPKFIANNS